MGTFYFHCLVASWLVVLMACFFLSFFLHFLPHLSSSVPCSPSFHFRCRCVCACVCAVMPVNYGAVCCVYGLCWLFLCCWLCACALPAHATVRRSSTIRRTHAVAQPQPHPCACVPAERHRPPLPQNLSTKDTCPSAQQQNPDTASQAQSCRQAPAGHQVQPTP